MFRFEAARLCNTTIFTIGIVNNNLCMGLLAFYVRCRQTFKQPSNQKFKHSYNHTNHTYKRCCPHAIKVYRSNSMHACMSPDNSRSVDRGRVHMNPPFREPPTKMVNPPTIVLQPIFIIGCKLSKTVTLTRISSMYCALQQAIGPRLNDCSMKHYIVLNMALFSHAHVTISAEIKLTHACSRGDVSHERTAAA